ncbi:hypothetical protein FB107DRAFT_204652 [Schizophyllum commune]
MSSATATDAGAETRCTVCNAITNLRCSRCSSVYYCGKEHISQDWKKHKVVCAALRAASNANLAPSGVPASPSQPSDNTFQAIMLHANEDAPRMITVDFEWFTEYDYKDQPYQIQALKDRQYFGQVAHPKQYQVKNMGMRGSALPPNRCLVVLYNDLFSCVDVPVNRCVKRLTRGKAPHAWGDNLIVLRQRPQDGYKYYASANLAEDIEVLRRFFEEYDVQPMLVSELHLPLAQRR